MMMEEPIGKGNMARHVEKVLGSRSFLLRSFEAPTLIGCAHSYLDGITQLCRLG